MFLLSWRSSAPLFSKIQKNDSSLNARAIRRCSCLNVSWKFGLYLEGKISVFSWRSSAPLFSKVQKDGSFLSARAIRLFCCLSARSHLYCWKFKRMARLLMLVRHDVSLVLTLVENLICTSREKCSPSLSARLHLYSPKFKRMALVLALVR